MKIVSIIGTRPQYIKIKPFHDYCKKNNIDHKIIDTLQHYSDNVSRLLIKDLELKIDKQLEVENSSEISFLSDLTLKLEKALREESPDFVLVYGDTNSTFIAGLVAYKMKIPIGHIEANLRCGDTSVPEEVNRIFVDTVSTIRFCSTVDSVKGSGDIYCGDLEYQLLNDINPKIEYQDYGVMTIHRQSNLSEKRLKNILNFCKQTSADIKFYAHHRTRPILNKIDIPSNVKIYESCLYTDMVKELASCKFIITDSGGINKTAPFFGKRVLIMRDKIEWTKTEQKGYARKSSLDKKDLSWLMMGALPPSKRFYLGIDNSSEIILEFIKKALN